MTVAIRCYFAVIFLVSSYRNKRLYNIDNKYK